MKYLILFFSFFVGLSNLQAQECINNARTVYSLSLEELNNKKFCKSISDDKAKTTKLNRIISQQKQCLNDKKDLPQNAVPEFTTAFYKTIDTSKLKDLEATIDNDKNTVGTNRRASSYVSRIHGCPLSSERSVEINIIYNPDSKKIRELIATSKATEAGENQKDRPQLFLTENSFTKTYDVVSLQQRFCSYEPNIVENTIKGIDTDGYRALYKIASYEHAFSSDNYSLQRQALDDFALELKENSEFKKLFNCNPSEAVNSRCKLANPDEKPLFSGPELKIRSKIYKHAQSLQKNHTHRHGLKEFIYTPDSFNSPNSTKVISPDFITLLGDLKKYALNNYKRMLINESSSLNYKNEAGKLSKTLTDNDFIAHVASSERAYKAASQIQNKICKNIRPSKTKTPLIINVVTHNDGGRLKDILSSNFTALATEGNAYNITINEPNQDLVKSATAPQKKPQTYKPATTAQ